MTEANVEPWLRGTLIEVGAVPSRRDSRGCCWPRRMWRNGAEV